jgi:hypothetical protein
LKAATERISSRKEMAHVSSAYLGLIVPRRKNQQKIPMRTLASHSSHIIAMYGETRLDRFQDAPDCWTAFTAVNILLAMENPHTILAMYISSEDGAGAWYPGETRNPAI